MKLVLGEKQLELTIDSYEFPYYQYNTYEDNNWLNVHVEWEDDVVREDGTTPCLTTSELNQLYEGLGKVLMGTDYHSDFLEPDLDIHLTCRQEQIQVEFTYTKPGRTPFHMEGAITKMQLDHMVSELHELCVSFPERKNTMLN